MSTDINTSQDFVKDRTEKTRAQWDADLVFLDATVEGSIAKVAAAMKANMLIRGAGAHALTHAHQP